MLKALLLLMGLAALLAGGQMLVRGATSLARRLGVAPVVVGLTVVAFGTSTPELVVNLTAAARGEGQLGFGNVVGSNIANIGLLLGITALYKPLVIHRTIVQREIPMLGLASALALILGVDQLTDSPGNGFARGDGIAMLLIFAVFLYYTLGEARHSTEPSTPRDSPEPAIQPPATPSLVAVGALVTLGLALLIGGGELTVRAAVGLARAMGVADKVIGLTMVAIGTSLPELATSLLAARQARHDLAMGNIVGSNIFNLLAVFALTVTIAPSPLPAWGEADLAVMLGFALVLLPLAWTQRRLGRAEAGVLLASYAAYIGWLASS